MDRTETLDTGDVPFWDALRQLCQHAGLVEDASRMGPFAGNGGAVIGDPRRIVSVAPGIHLEAGKPVQC
jgi:hypothetical protein